MFFKASHEKGQVEAWFCLCKRHCYCINVEVGAEEKGEIEEDFVVNRNPRQ